MTKVRVALMIIKAGITTPNVVTCGMVVQWVGWDRSGFTMNINYCYDDDDRIDQDLKIPSEMEGAL